MRKCRACGYLFKPTDLRSIDKIENLLYIECNKCGNREPYRPVIYVVSQS